jgi:dihydroorotate dehydrogenase
MLGLKLRGVDFGSALIASGALNFFGNGYPFHRLFKLLFPNGFDFSGGTFVAKTTTLGPRPGNMPLKTNLQPREILPRCIVVNFRRGIVLNAVGLSGPGVIALLQSGRWQRRRKPFFISFMSVGQSKETRLDEIAVFAVLLEKELHNFQTNFGLQINISCPNTNHNPAELAEEATEYLKIVRSLGIPIDLKINVMTPIETVRLICQKDLMDSLTISNTIPWGQIPKEINWMELFGTDKSPLAQFGGGGLSGVPLLPIVGKWVDEARRAGIDIPIIAGGGILAPDDVDYLFDCGASAIALGSVAILRPWRVRAIIDRANEITGRR